MVQRPSDLSVANANYKDITFFTNATSPKYIHIINVKKDDLATPVRSVDP